MGFFTSTAEAIEQPLPPIEGEVLPVAPEAVIEPVVIEVLPVIDDSSSKGLIEIPHGTNKEIAQLLLDGKSPCDIIALGHADLHVKETINRLVAFKLIEGEYNCNC
jgi:hypothetical protein